MFITNRYVNQETAVIRPITTLDMPGVEGLIQRANTDKTLVSSVWDSMESKSGVLY